MIEIENTSGESLFCTFKEFLDKKYIEDPKKIAAVATDGAGNMTGSRSGFVTRLK